MCIRDRRYSLRLLLAYLVYIFTGGVLAYLLPRQARNLPQTDSFYGIGRGPDRAVLVEEPQDAFARRVEVIRTAQSTLAVSYTHLDVYKRQARSSSAFGFSSLMSRSV